MQIFFFPDDNFWPLKSSNGDRDHTPTILWLGASVNLPPQNVSAVGKRQQLTSVIGFWTKRRSLFCSPSPDGEAGWCLSKTTGDEMGVGQKKQKSNVETGVKILTGLLGGKKTTFWSKNGKTFILWWHFPASLLTAEWSDSRPWVEWSCSTTMWKEEKKWHAVVDVEPLFHQFTLQKISYGCLYCCHVAWKGEFEILEMIANLTANRK